MQGLDDGACHLCPRQHFGNRHSILNLVYILYPLPSKNLAYQKTDTCTHQWDERWNDLSTVEKPPEVHGNTRATETCKPGMEMKSLRRSKRCTVGLSALRRLRLEDCKFQTILGYIARFCLRKKTKSHSLMLQGWLKSSPWGHRTIILSSPCLVSSTSKDSLSVWFVVHLVSYQYPWIDAEVCWAIHSPSFKTLDTCLGHLPTWSWAGIFA